MIVVHDRQQPEAQLARTRMQKKKGTGENALEKENLYARLIMEGNEVAIMEIYERFLQPIYGYFYRRIGNTIESEDLTTSTFLHALQCFNVGVTFTQGCSPWLFGIAHSILLAWHAQTSPISLLVLSTERLESIGNSVLNEILAREKTHLLWDLINRLSSNFQQVLIMRYKNGLSYMEIALQMKCTVNECKTMHGRAMKKLRDIMRKEYAGEFSANALFSFQDR